MRADKFFAGRFHSRTKAAEALLKGLVLRGGKELRPSDDVSEKDEFQFVGERLDYVSNGGYKLERGLDYFQESAEGAVAVDLGASTGGFTDVLLQRGAKKVYCVDVGENQLDESIAKDRRTVVMDRTNARYLTQEVFPERIGLIVSDVSFISLKLIFPAIVKVLCDGGRAIVLVKPQFEAGKERIGKGGIVPKKFHEDILRDIYAAALLAGLSPMNIINAPVRERKNIEYVVLLKKGGFPLGISDFLKAASSFFESETTFCKK